MIADISGYTRFMLTHHTARVHAHGIVSDLLAAVAGQAREPLAVNKFEGDAIFMVATRLDAGWLKAGRDISGRLTAFVDAFHEKLAELTASNICHCIACQ